MKKFILFLIVAFLVGGTIAYKLYNKPHDDLRRMSPDVTTSANEIFKSYDEDEEKANLRYLGKVVEIEGEITEVSKNKGRVSLILIETGNMMSNLACSLDKIVDDHRQDFKVGESVTLQCICTGRLIDIEFNRCVEK